MLFIIYKLKKILIFLSNISNMSHFFIFKIILKRKKRVKTRNKCLKSINMKY